MSKEDYGAAHWSSDKVWGRRKKEIVPVVTDPDFWKKKVDLKLDVITLLTIHGNLCLALRHPQNKGESRKLAVAAAQQIGVYLVKIGAMTEHQLKDAYREEARQGSADLE